MGDVITDFPALRALVKRHPNARVKALLHRLARERARKEIELDLKLSVMAMEIRSIVEDEMAISFGGDAA